MMGHVGLDYPAVFMVAEILGIEVNKPLLIKLRELESAALQEIYKKSEE